MNLDDRINTKELIEILGLEDKIVETVKHRSLGWLGHVLRKGNEECFGD